VDIRNAILFPDEIQSIKNDKSRFIPLDKEQQPMSRFFILKKKMTSAATFSRLLWPPGSIDWPMMNRFISLPSIGQRGGSEHSIRSRQTRPVSNRFGFLKEEISLKGNKSKNMQMKGAGVFRPVPKPNTQLDGFVIFRLLAAHFQTSHVDIDVPRLFL
jgi:hypothetical protein